MTLRLLFIWSLFDRVPKLKNLPDEVLQKILDTMQEVDFNIGYFRNIPNGFH